MPVALRFFFFNSKSFIVMLNFFYSTFLWLLMQLFVNGLSVIGKIAVWRCTKPNFTIW